MALSPFLSLVPSRSLSPHRPPATFSGTSSGSSVSWFGTRGAEEEGVKATAASQGLVPAAEAAALSPSFSSSLSFSSIALFALAAFAAHSPALAPGTEGPATPFAEITTPLDPREAALSAALAVPIVAAVAAVALVVEEEEALVFPILLTNVPHEGHLAAENLARHDAEGTPPDHMPASQTLPRSSKVAPA